MTRLDCEAVALCGAVEILLLDDGGGDIDIALSVTAATQAMKAPAEFISISRNEGRAKSRNKLAARARGNYLLFLDCDMLPDSTSFLTTYLGLIEAENPAVVVGGTSLLQAPYKREYALDWYWQSLSCLPAAVRHGIVERDGMPERKVITQNLLVRRDIFSHECFNEEFSGWGWEDVEWGARVVTRWSISHVDNAATHLGLNTANVLVKRCRESVPNFARFVTAHPGRVADYPSYRAARLMRRAPLRHLWRPFLAALVLTPLLPLPARLLALRLYRSTLYADIV